MPSDLFDRYPPDGEIDADERDPDDIPLPERLELHADSLEQRLDDGLVLVGGRSLVRDLRAARDELLDTERDADDE